MWPRIFRETTKPEPPILTRVMLSYPDHCSQGEFSIPLPQEYTMSDSTTFRVTVPGLYLKRDGGVQRIVWVGYDGSRTVAIGFDGCVGCTDWGECGLWMYEEEDARETTRDLVALIKADEPTTEVQPVNIAGEAIEVQRVRAASVLLASYDYRLRDAYSALSKVHGLSSTKHPC